MYPQDFRQRHPAVPPLYPMDPCRPKPYEPAPMPYEPMPMEPYMPSMPYMHCPMMDPRFRDCIRVCMMQCGNYSMESQYPIQSEYSQYMAYGAVDFDNILVDNIDINKPAAYYSEETK